MLIPSFKISNKDTIYITKDYFCNGHWLVKRSAAENRVCGLFKAFSKLSYMQLGSYANGTLDGITSETTPDMAAIIPQREGYRKVNPAPVGVTFKNETWVEAYKFEVAHNENDIGLKHFTFRVDPSYVPLMQLGTCFAKDALSPILILGGDSLNDELIGAVMPRRL